MGHGEITLEILNLVQCDAFMSLPYEAQTLFFHYLMICLEKGIVINPKAVAKSLSIDTKYYDLLLSENYIEANETFWGIKINGIRFVEGELN